MDFVPVAYALEQNFPDPFNPATTLQFDVPAPAVVTLEVFDIAGHRVAMLVEKKGYQAGRYRIRFNAGSLATGLYVCRLQAGPHTMARKMLLLK